MIVGTCSQVVLSYEQYCGLMAEIDSLRGLVDESRLETSIALSRVRDLERKMVRLENMMNRQQGSIMRLEDVAFP